MLPSIWNDDPLDEMLESIKVMKEKRASKYPINTQFCMEIADQLDHMPDRQSAIKIYNYYQV